MELGKHTLAAIASINAGSSNGTFSSDSVKVDARYPKFSMMQRIRHIPTGHIRLILGTPTDGYRLANSGEAAYTYIRAHEEQHPDDAYEIVVISQRAFENPEHWEAVEQKVYKGINPKIEDVPIAPREQHLDELGYDIGYTR